MQQHQVHKSRGLHPGMYQREQLFTLGAHASSQYVQYLHSLLTRRETDCSSSAGYSAESFHSDGRLSMQMQQGFFFFFSQKQDTDRQETAAVNVRITYGSLHKINKNKVCIPLGFKVQPKTFHNSNIHLKITNCILKGPQYSRVI